jgi:hypothetical protein
MADQPAHVAAFNVQVAELLKAAQPQEIVDILTNSESLIRPDIFDTNNNNNQHPR